MNDFITLSEAARIMGIARSTLYRLIKAGKLTAYRSAIRQDVKLVKRADVNALMTPTPIDDAASKRAA